MAETFEMAMHDGYRETPCKLVGAFAIHKEGEKYWRVTHAATGLYTSLWGETRKRAVELAEVLGSRADWSKIKRTKDIWKPRGVTAAHLSAVRKETT